MTTKIKYREHMTAADIKRLLDRLDELDQAYAIAGVNEPPHKDEGSLDHFNRYVADDK